MRNTIKAQKKSNEKREKRFNEILQTENPFNYDVQAKSQWIETARKIRQHGIVAHIMMAASFSSVLVEPLGLLPFFLHIWGGTEAGKTVGLMVAASVWADPDMGEYIRTFNSTSVAQEVMAGFCNSLPICMDELQIIKDRADFDKTIYMLTEGIGRGRGAKSGGMQKTYTWRNCIITTGEMPISNPNSGGGAVNRIIEIDCKDNDAAKSIMECAKDEVLAVLDPDAGEDILSWRVDPK